LSEVPGVFDFFVFCSPDVFLTMTAMLSLVAAFVMGIFHKFQNAFVSSLLLVCLVVLNRSESKAVCIVYPSLSISIILC
jgi:hypothetical protein